MVDRYPSVLLFGAPGVGKGTQGKVLGTVPGFFHMSTGDMFRSLDQSSQLAKVFHEYSAKGELVPDDLTVRLWQDYMMSRYEPLDPRPIALLDGIPRDLDQALLMDRLINVQRVLHLVAPDLDILVERLRKRAIEQGRPDDADGEVIRNRYKVYQEETAPVLGHYPSELVVEIDALDTPVGVLGQVIEAIAPIADAGLRTPVAARLRK